ncbi:MAG: 50S ribosomal protein L30 [Bdellovibrionales bacterium RIFOXYD12_FULL_39_22]|nr:MAG: 50S ribosomal protein L30 [Bdellovibrionales bacterium RIFOXYB1_FULL_39_21]OFZ43368.1 MAG: 50S ribosomal protein L30 [Bdellovibrionales bacterium RIFOXYC12_FULL_39_17]OFZ47407.1 MAG: 50S ribosomal protein L30 [Bdellovibrionales bacterium RIFOXYC1_FULL_39_130]OFZ70445.1 MAG: 50S ribosomal protein L30 [Bdellovibrionales bacterium RIFOXYC2_FULL_39_8]OFZ76287.1 MAG: 50S ribosomal protein L30 [Bdellovibrionales bacterium RIFOXYD1_FULL_39_84]OFZ94325.1 MAG: 50S ribosomal protein L30 [Bdellov
MAKKTITVKLKKSTNGITEKLKANVRGLGLRKINSTRTLENTPCVRGMIKKVIHLVEINEK